MEEVQLGFKTLEDAEEFITTLEGEYVIVGLCEKTLFSAPFAFYVKEKNDGL
jgi:hypothetical protein